MYRLTKYLRRRVRCLSPCPFSRPFSLLVRFPFSSLPFFISFSLCSRPFSLFLAPLLFSVIRCSCCILVLSSLFHLFLPLPSSLPFCPALLPSLSPLSPVSDLPFIPTFPCHLTLPFSSLPPFALFPSLLPALLPSSSPLSPASDLSFLPTFPFHLTLPLPHSLSLTLFGPFPFTVSPFLMLPLPPFPSVPLFF